MAANMSSLNASSQEGSAIEEEPKEFFLIFLVLSGEP
jgi:hypothetical protein